MSVKDKKNKVSSSNLLDDVELVDDVDILKTIDSLKDVDLKTIVLSVGNKFNITFKTDNESIIVVDLNTVVIDEEYYAPILDKNNVLSFKNNALYYLNSLNTKLNNNKILNCIETVNVILNKRIIILTLNNFNDNIELLIDSIIKTNKSIVGVFERDIRVANGTLGSSNKSRSKAPLFEIVDETDDEVTSNK